MERCGLHLFFTIVGRDTHFPGFCVHDLCFCDISWARARIPSVFHDREKIKRYAFCLARSVGRWGVGGRYLFLRFPWSCGAVAGDGVPFEGGPHRRMGSSRSFRYYYLFYSSLFALCFILDGPYVFEYIAGPRRRRGATEISRRGGMGAPRPKMRPCMRADVTGGGRAVAARSGCPRYGLSRPSPSTQCQLYPVPTAFCLSNAHHGDFESFTPGGARLLNF